MFFKDILCTVGCCLALSNLNVECSELSILEQQRIIATSQLSGSKTLNIVGHGRTQMNEVDVFLEQKLSVIQCMSQQNRLAYIFSLARALEKFVAVETKTYLTNLAVTFPTRTGSEVKQLTHAIQHDVKIEEPMKLISRPIIDAGISCVLTASITNFLSGRDVNDSAEAIRYNISELLGSNDPDKGWLLDIIDPLETGNEAAKKLYADLSRQINE